MLAIKNNSMATNAARHLSDSYDALSTSVERLSSGLRINSAKDDAAGMAVRELMRADIAVLEQGSRNADDGISMLQTMEGAMGVIDENLIRMKELAEQAATGSYSDDQRTIMNSEFAQMAAEIDRIANNTTFNGISMLNNSSDSVGIHVGSSEKIDIEKVDMTTEGLGIKTGTSGYAAQSDHGVASVSDTWLTVSDAGANAGDDTLTLNIAFDNGEDAIAVEFTGADSGSTNYTLEEVVDAINEQSQNLGNDADGNSKAYAMAEAVYDSDSNKYYLKVSSRTAGATDVAITLSESHADISLAGGFEDTTGSIAEAEGTADGDQGRMTKMAGTGINILDVDAAQAALTSVTSAITAKDEARAGFGYKMNRLESTSSILGIQIENLQASESRISDVDVATEMADMTKNQVLAQAGVSMLSQANGMPQMALSLLR